MKPRTLLGVARVPDTDRELRLYESDGRYTITILGRGELMGSRMHGSERALAELACDHVRDRPGARVLVGGLGIGFTLAAALATLGSDARVVVAELVPEVVDWNRQWLGGLAGHPLADPRVEVFVGDVAEPIRVPRDGFDAIMLDVDNGPEALLRRENDWLYSLAGLAAIRRALRPGGALAVWSAGPDAQFSRRIAQAGFAVTAHVVRARDGGKGPRHHIWIAR